jgi:hypothetical protein
MPKTGLKKKTEKKLDKAIEEVEEELAVIAEAEEFDKDVKPECEKCEKPIPVEVGTDYLRLAELSLAGAYAFLGAACVFQIADILSSLH